MTRPEQDYVTELAVQLRLVGMNGEQIGAILEETRDHLEASGQDPEEAFGHPSEYAEALARSQDVVLPRRPLQLTHGDLVAAAVQLLGFMLLLGGVAAMARGGRGQGVDLVPGHVAGLVALTGGLAWPMWPATRAYLARKVSIVIPIMSGLAVIAALVVLTTVWDDPVLATVPAWTAMTAGAGLIAGCWIRVWRLRDPVRRPSPDGSLR